MIFTLTIHMHGVLVGGQLFTRSLANLTILSELCQFGCHAITVHAVGQDRMSSENQITCG